MVKFRKILDIFPDIFPRDPESNLYKYTEAHQDEARSFEDKLEEVENSHFIDQATGEDLDRVGAMFGPLGDRAGRTDEEYRIYLKSIVQAYRGAGTVPAIKKAVAAGLGIEEDKVRITENFSQLSYQVELLDWPEHDGSMVEELADLADASVADFSSTIYVIEDEVMEIGDSFFIDTGTKYEDLMHADDALSINANNPTLNDLLSADDPVSVNGSKNKFSDTSLGDDIVGIDPGKTNVTDTSLGDDIVTTDSTTGKTPRWEDSPDQENNWDFFGWADVTTLNLEFTETTHANDPVTTSTTSVAWEEGSWETMAWAKAG